MCIWLHCTSSTKQNIKRVYLQHKYTGVYLLMVSKVLAMGQVHWLHHSETLPEN